MENLAIENIEDGTGKGSDMWSQNLSCSWDASDQ